MAEHPDSQPPGAVFRALRIRMDWSRPQVASFLGVAKKTVESYEQGWREIPDRVWKQMITIAALQLGYPVAHHRRCFEITSCPPAFREACFSFEKMGGNFCWMTATNSCRRAHLGRDSSYLACLDCPVTRQFLAPAGNPDEPESRPPADPAG